MKIPRIKPARQYYKNILLVISMLVTAVVIVSSLVTMLNMHALLRDRIITE